jgi:flagellar biosynthesis/type III secretory pathway protein FliH
MGEVQGVGGPESAADDSAEKRLVDHTLAAAQKLLASRIATLPAGLLTHVRAAANEDLVTEVARTDRSVTS